MIFKLLKIYLGFLERKLDQRNYFKFSYSCESPFLKLRYLKI